MSSREQLSGDPDATLERARAMLRAAREEARSDRRFACRQAAQKVWLAAATAADALAGPRESGQQVIEAFRKAWGAKGAEAALTVNAALHIGVHYSNATCTPGLIDKHARDLGALLASPVKDAQMRKRLAKRARR